MKRIAVLDDYQNVALTMADWRGLGAACEVTAFDDHLDDLDALVERLRGFQIICMMRERTPFTRELLTRLPDLELLLTGGKRNNSIDLVAAAEHGVTVCGTRAPGHATAELTWGLILALMRRIPAEQRDLLAGRWQTGLGLDLRDKTLGVIGLGRLGSQVATVGLAFGMRVIAWSENLTDERAAEVGVARVDKRDLLSQSDVITIHLILGERSRNLIDAAELADMQPGAYLINTSRAPIVNQSALLSALQGKAIAGAALDVYEQEPLPADNLLRQLDNVVLTPHIGFVTEETYRVFYGEMVEDIAAYLAGEPIRVLGGG